MQTAKNRLEIYKIRASEARGYFKDWRQCRYGFMAGYRKNCEQFTRKPDGRIFADTLEIIGEYVGDFDSIVSRARHSGYYCDNYQDGLIKPGVIKLRHARGVDYIPVTSCTAWDGVTLYAADTFRVQKGAPDSDHIQAIGEAAHRADHYAEREGEQGREDDAKFQAEQEAEQLAEDIKDARQTARGLIAAIKAQRKAGIDLSGAICDALTDKLREYRRQIIKARERREALKENYWLAVEGY